MTMGKSDSNLYRLKIIIIVDFHQLNILSVTFYYTLVVIGNKYSLKQDLGLSDIP